MKIIAIIPARGGSKGIPLKNIKIIAGKPLIAYNIEAANNSRFIERVYVTTDHPEISAISKLFGASVINRPGNISGDSASSETAILHALKHIKNNENYLPDICVFLQCTSPLTLAEDIDGTIEKLISDNADSALSVTTFHYFLWRVDKNKDAFGINHDKTQRILRQKQNDQFLENGAVYVCRVQDFLKKKHRFFGQTSVFVMPRERCFEIDDPIDIKIAEVMIRENKTKSLINCLPKKIDAIVFDFDGVFTNNNVIVDQNGKESVLCDRSDGLGISRIKKYMIPILVLSAEKNKVVAERCKKLGLDCIQESEKKSEDLKKWLKKINAGIQNTIFVGNDVNDKECLNEVGCSIVVEDAHHDVKKLADIILTKPGGRGAVRELTSLIEKKWEKNNDGKNDNR